VELSADVGDPSVSVYDASDDVRFEMTDLYRIWRRTMRRGLWLVTLAVVGLVCMPACKRQGDSDEAADEKAAQTAQDEESPAGSADDEKPEPTSNGLVEVESKKSFEATLKGLTEAIDSNDKLTLMAKVDHAAHSEDAIEANTLFVFGNPNMGGPMMKEGQTAGIDLPQKVVVWKDKNNAVHVALNAPDYVAKRHGIESLGLFRSQMETTLTSVIESATGVSIGSMPQAEEIAVDTEEGLITEESQNSVATTFRGFKKQIEENEDWSLVAEIDHTKNAEEVGRSVPPTRLLMIQNASMTSPLVAAKQSLGIEFPVRLLIYETKAAEILVSYDDPAYMAERHGLDGQKERLKKLARELEQMVAIGIEEK
jgi:uncharacterized protein (DUF302 family)